jgi:phosphate starvation-inducible PhoH-like protein
MSKNAARLRRRKTDQDNFILDKNSAKERIMHIADEEEAYKHTQPIPKFNPANINQKKALSLLKAGKPVVFLTGSAGTGKSMLAAYHAACELKQKKIDKLYLVRPAVVVGKSIGLLPGDIKEKLEPYFAQTFSHLEKFLGHGFMNYCLSKDIIETKPVEYLRGMSFEHCIVIAEELQNFTPAEMEMLLTRLGDGATIIMTGDSKQHDLKGESGLETTVRLLDRMSQTQPSYLSREDIDNLNDGIGIVRFTPDDVVRSGLAKAFVKMYYHNY